VSKLRAYLLIDPLIVLATAFMGTVSLFASLADSSGRLPHRIARAWSRMLIFVSGMRVRVEGLEWIEPGASYVIASNHLSLMDTPLVLAHIRSLAAICAGPAISPSRATTPEDRSRP
jgi:1-acyl-sn-glycerol-3-phosphate acyltransferase